MYNDLILNFFCKFVKSIFKHLTKLLLNYNDIKLKIRMKITECWLIFFALDEYSNILPVLLVFLKDNDSYILNIFALVIILF